MSTTIVISIVLAAGQMIWNVLIGIVSWQYKRDQSKRDAEIADIRRNAAEMRAALDTRCERRLAEQHEREIAVAVQVERTIQAGLREFATKEEFAANEDRRRSDTARLFASLDAVNRELASLRATLDERTGKA
jgi:hypothetical protein